MIHPTISRQNLIIASVLLILSVPFFWYLGNHAIQIWDESRTVGHAWEAYANGHWWTVHFDGDAEFFWNTRPPLMMWSQAGMAKLIGFNEWAIRLPAALAAWATMLLVFHWVGRSFGDTRWGMLAAATLAGSSGFLGYHTARTGDVDSLLVWWVVLAAYSLFRATAGASPSGKWLFTACIALAAAVLTKSVAGLIMAPAMGLWVIYRRQFAALWTNGLWYAGIAAFLAMVAGYYGYREWLSPGYLEAAWQAQAGRRFLETIEGHHHPIYYYLLTLVNHHFAFWWLLIMPLLIWPKALRSDPQSRRMVQYSALLGLSFILIISVAQTKLPWYTMPSIPFLAILAAAGSRILFQKMQGHRLVALGLVLFAMVHVGVSYNRTLKPERFDRQKPFYAASYWLRDQLRMGNLDGTYIWYDGFKPHLQAYTWIAADRGQTILFTDEYGLEPGRVILVAQEENRAYLEVNYRFEVLAEGPGYKVYRITDAVGPSY